MINFIIARGMVLNPVRRIDLPFDGCRNAAHLLRIARHANIAGGDLQGRTWRQLRIWHEGWATGVPSFCRSYRGLDYESPARPECLEGPIESGDPQRQDVEKAWQLPAHPRTLEATLNDMLARALHRPGPHSQPTLPGLLVPEAGPVALDVADQLGERVADGLFPGPHALERTQDLPDAVREQRPDFLVHPCLGPRRVIGV